MARKSDFDIQDILKRYDACQQFYSESYQRGEEDTNFVLGEQYPLKIKQQRERDGRPCLTENRMLPFVHQVINQIRQARPSIVPKPVDDGADVETAEILRGVIRNIETISDADTVYDTAARNSVMSGVGWIRIITEYAAKDSFDQEIRLERVQNPRSVYLDPNHQRQDGSDAEYGFVFIDMDKDRFCKQYPDCDVSTITTGGWVSDKTVRVAEYFEKKYVEKDLIEYEIVTIGGVSRAVAFEGKVPFDAVELKRRKSYECSIRYAKLNGAEILEEGEFAGEYIPLVPVYGFEALQDGKRTFFSLIHQAKDPQMMLNYWRSTSTEVVALQPKAPFIGAKGQFDSYAGQWASANQQNFPFLEYDPVTTPEGVPLPAPQRQAPPTSSGTLMQEAAFAADAIKASLGMFDAAMGMQSADISGKAIISRQMQGDNATYHFVDNLAVAIRQVGRILVGLIPIIYTGQRILRIMGEDGKDSMVPINMPVVKQGNEYKPASQVADPAVSRIIRFDAGKYDVVVEVGASYATKRQELANAIVEIYRVNPEIMNIAGDYFMKALDVPYAEEIAKRIRSTMPPALLGDDLEAQRLQQLTAALTEMQNKLQLTEDALLAKTKNEEFKNQLEAQKVENDTKKLMIEAAKAEAEIEKIKSEINAPIANLNAIDAVLMDLQGKVADVAGALDLLLASEEGAGEATGMPKMPEPQSESETDDDRPIIGSAQ